MKLSPEHLQDAEARIRAAVAAVQARGWIVAPGDGWGPVFFNKARPIPGTKCCPMAAVVMDPPSKSDDDYAERAAARLGWSYAQVEAFTRGFDGAPRYLGDDWDVYDLGAKFREELT